MTLRTAGDQMPFAAGPGSVGRVRAGVLPAAVGAGGGAVDDGPPQVEQAALAGHGDEAPAGPSAAAQSRPFPEAGPEVLPGPQPSSWGSGCQRTPSGCTGSIPGVATPHEHDGLS